ncbi:MFS transporter [Candidatus Aerophobetes bacterium]|uniref:MFS transporter n=1 Tax=Aerophobetes bacterium TaxID=2030807 RepID=A0A7V5LZD2_UNCAE|nr:MFS transporter [Candidatus Aerophobetes bacterium]HHF98445.1 MFS transporter [Candidatus Aerophobetes bacterium]
MKRITKSNCLSRNSRILLKASFWGHAFNDMYWVIIPVVLPIIKSEFKLNYSMSGLLLTSYTLMGAFGSLITGYLGDKTGRRFILSWGFFLGSLALVLCAISKTYWQLFFALLLLGVGISAFHPSMIAVISTNFTSKRGTTLGIFQFWGWVGTFLVVGVISSFLEFFLNWRGLLLILSVPGFIFAPLFFRLLKDLTVQEQKIPPSEKNPQEKLILPLLLFLIANIFFIASYTALINFIPTYLVEEKSMSPSLAGYFFLIVIGGGFLGTILSGKASDRISSLLTLLIFVGIAAPAIIILTFLRNYFFILISLIIFGFSYSGVWAPQQDYLAEKTPSHLRGGIYGLTFFLANTVSATSPGITGIIADKTGLSNALRILALPLFLSLILIFSIKKREER